MTNRKVESGRVPRTKGLDRRIRLTDDERREIRENLEGLSARVLAARYGVSRRLVQFIQCPEKQQLNFELRQQRGGYRQYYSAERHRIAMRDHRDYKKKLLVEGKLEVPEE
jgi:hypothetical protein